MKILYIYSDYKGRRERYGNEMKRLGHDVFFLDVNKNIRDAIKIKKVKESKPDVVWLLNPYYVSKNEEAFDYFSSKKIPTIVYGTLSPQTPFMDWMKVWEKIDILFIHNKECSDYLKSCGLKSYYMPIGFYPDMYRRSIKKKKLDVSFCGGIRPSVKPREDKRCRYVQELDKFKIKVYGKSFKGKLKGIPVIPFETHSKQMSVYAKTKINLDLPFYSGVHPFYDNRTHIKNRFFEIPATGNFMLTFRCEEATNIYGEDMVGYYESEESIADSVKKYLLDETERKRMAKTAYNFVNEKHTFNCRFKEMFSILKDIL